MAITMSDLIQFFKYFTVSKYNGDVKNSSKRVLDSFACFLVKLEPLLKVISTVKSVKIKPALVRLIFDKSAAIFKLYSSFGNLNIFLKSRKATIAIEKIAIKKSQKTGFLK
jgi:predicted phosphatase